MQSPYHFNSKYSCLNRTGNALVVSFFAGKTYYHEKAIQLHRQLDALGLDYDLCELRLEAAPHWPTICKAKIEFYARMIQVHNRPIFWVDIDTTILRVPLFLTNVSADFGGFLRNFKSLPEFEPHQYARLFHPGYLLFNTTAKTKSFIAHMQGLVKQHTMDCTDDFILQEAFSTFPKHLQILLFSPDLIDTGKESINVPDPCFLHGESGHVSEFREKVKQHSRKQFSTTIQIAVLESISRELFIKKNYLESLVFIKRARELDFDKKSTFQAQLRLLKKLKNRRELEKVLQHALQSPCLHNEAVLWNLQYNANLKNPRAIRSLYEQSLKAGNLEAVAFLRSRLFRISLDERAKALGIRDIDRVPLWWWEKPYPGNLGDILNPYIIEKITGIPPLYTNKSRRLFACGSILPHCTPDVMVWGSGFPRKNAAVCPHAQYFAVRGPLSRQLILNAGGKCPEIYGDPALLLPLYYRPKKYSASKAPYGLILHHNHSHKELKIDHSEVDLISIMRLGYSEIESFIDEVASKKIIFSTSLHGIIIAHAYGVPAVWCSLSNQLHDVPGDGMKFIDYFTSIEINDNIRPVDLANVSIIDSKLENHAISPPKHFNTKVLLAAFPFGKLSENAPPEHNNNLDSRSNKKQWALRIISALRSKY